MDSVKSVRFFNPGLGYKNIKPEIDVAIEKNLLEGQLILREETEQFEKTLANFVGTKYAVGLNSGTDALYLALKAAGVKAGDEVITVGHTFVATVQVIVQLGAKPVLIDINDDALIDHNEIEKAINARTTAIIPVHLTGDVCNMKVIQKIARDYNLILIEDAAQALGAEWDGQKAGSFGIGCFSFYPAKILGAYGDAGGLTTNSKEIYDTVIELRNHWKSDYSDWGINSRLDNIQAAVLNVKFRYLNDALEKRQRVAERYLNQLADLPVGLPTSRSGRVWQDFILRTPKRDELYEYLKRNGVETMKNEYPFPIPKPERSIAYENETLRLPCNELLTDEEVGYVVNKIREYYGADLL